jgi:CSLREA domain-containing protein
MSKPHRRIHPLAAALAAVFLAAPVQAATFTVNDNGDQADANPGNGVCATLGDVCTLRAAIQEANALVGADNIHFNLSGGGGGTILIQPTTPLPQIVSPIHIDGYTQPGATPNTLAAGFDANFPFHLDGTNAVAAAGADNGLMLGTGSGTSTIRGMAITNWSDRGIVIASFGTGFVIAGNGIWANGSNGLAITTANGALVGGPAVADRNMIASNAGAQEVSISNAGNVEIQNNFIGTSSGNNRAVSNSAGHLDGIFVGNNTTDIQIFDNVVTGNRTGILVGDGGAIGVYITNNKIGVGADGVANLGSALATSAGIWVAGGVDASPSTVQIGGIGVGNEWHLHKLFGRQIDL